MVTSVNGHNIKVPFYNYISVRDQVITAKQKNKCDYKLMLPKNIIGISIDNTTWETECHANPCTAGCCEVFLFILFNNRVPLKINIYYIKKAPIAYVTFLPSILDYLKKQKILDNLEIVPDDLLPRTAPFKGKI
jgi:hypothetical protein